MEHILYDELSYEDSRVYTLKGIPFTGVAFEYFKSGSVASEIHFFEGMQNGIVRDFYPTGNIKYEANYVMGLKQGIETEWYDDGSLKEENVLHQGYLMQSKKLSRSGELINEYVRPASDVIFGMVHKKNS